MPQQAFLDISADDYYKLYMNGVFVGQGPAQGYSFCYPYNRIDITRYLTVGTNVLAVQVYYQGLINRAYNSGDYRQGFIAELFYGEDRVLGSDSTWKYTSTDYHGTGATLGYETQYLENIDARLEEAGWKTNEFDDSGWLPCVERIAFNMLPDVLLALILNEIRLKWFRTRTRNPRTSRKTP